MIHKLTKARQLLVLNQNYAETKAWQTSDYDEFARHRAVAMVELLKEIIEKDGILLSDAARSLYNTL